MSGRAIAWAGVAALLSAVCPRESWSQPVPPAQASNAEKERALRERITASLDVLAARLEREAVVASTLVAQVQTASPTELPNVLERAATQQAGAYRWLGSTSIDVAREASTATQTETSRRLVTEDVRGKAAEFHRYSEYLRNLKANTQSAPIDEVLRSLEAEFVPRDVAIVIGPAPIAPPAPGAPLPFGDAPPASGLFGDLIPFVVGLGATTVDYPAVGAIQFTDSASGGLTIKCTGTLVAPNVVLTAQHCNAFGAPRSVFFQHAGTFEVHQPPRMHPNYRFPERDLMLLYLKQRVTGVQHVDLKTDAALMPQSRGNIIGFGWHRPFTTPDQPPAPPTAINQKSGVKVFAHVSTSSCSGEYSGKNLICWSYPVGDTQPLTGSNCVGDSGGPLFVFNDGWRLAGVTIGGTGCTPGHTAVDTEVYTYRNWIRDGIAAQPVNLPPENNPIRALGPVLNAEDRYPVAISERILDSGGRWNRKFSVASDMQLMRLAINAIPSATNLSLTIQTASPDLKCAQDVDATTTSCEFATPPKGEWSIAVAGAPFQEFQVVATAF